MLMSTVDAPDERCDGVATTNEDSIDAKLCGHGQDWLGAGIAHAGGKLEWFPGDGTDWFVDRNGQWFGNHRRHDDAIARVRGRTHEDKAHGDGEDERSDVPFHVRRPTLKVNHRRSQNVSSKTMTTPGIT